MPCVDLLAWLRMRFNKVVIAPMAVLHPPAAATFATEAQSLNNKQRIHLCQKAGFVITIQLKKSKHVLLSTALLDNPLLRQRLHTNTGV